MGGTRRASPLLALATVLALCSGLAAEPRPTASGTASPRRFSLAQWWRDLTQRHAADENDHANWELATRVRTALHQHPELTGFNFAVIADTGRITLFGAAPSRYLRTKAGETAKKVRGVKEVRNEIQVRDIPPEPDDAPPRFPPIDQPWPRAPLGKPVPSSEPNDARRPMPSDLLPPNPAAPRWERVNAECGALLPPRLVPANTNPVSSWNRTFAPATRPPLPLPDLFPPEARQPNPSPATVPFGLTRRADAEARPPQTAGHVEFNLQRLLASNPQFAGVVAENAAGTVVLTGEVGGQSDLEDLVAAIRAIPGVRSVCFAAVTVSP